MALLYRFAQLHDRGGTRVFSFVVTRNVIRDPERDITSKELVCGFQRWAVAFSRGDKVLGVYLVWRSATRGLRVYVDFTFTLLNREHFSVNEGFSGKKVKFTFDAPAQGNRNYISVSDLYTRNFADPNGEFQLELTMANIRTVFSDEVSMPSGIFSSQSRINKLETEFFTFAGFNWNLIIYPSGNKDVDGSYHDVYQGGLSIYLMRHKEYNHYCRVKYSITIGENDNKIESGSMEDLLDVEGTGYGWHPQVKWSDISHKGSLRVTLEMMEAKIISEIMVQTIGPSMLPEAACYDRDKQAWSVRADLHSDTVRLHLVFKDIHSIPRNHLRYVSWTAFLVRGESSKTELVSLPGAPFSRYYAQEAADEGIIMETNLDVNEVKNERCSYMTNKGQIRVRIEWNESHLLFQATYHKYDDVCRIHNQQMRREIAALQAENYTLERQLFIYQKSLAYAHAQQNQQSSHSEHLQRSTSTDTEYA